MTDNSTPTSLGYRWPAEWEPHSATWMSWPHNRNSWPGRFEPVPAQFAGLVRAIATVERVRVLAGGDAVMADARQFVGNVPMSRSTTFGRMTRGAGITALLS